MSDLRQIGESRKANREAQSGTDWAQITELRYIADSLEGLRQDLLALCQIAGTFAARRP